jgi:hypothetical protein
VTDLALAALIAASIVFLVVVLSADVVRAHTDIEPVLPLPAGRTRLRRRALIVEIPILVGLVGGGGLLLLLVLGHPGSSPPVRLVAAAALVGGAIWLAYLGRRLLRRGDRSGRRTGPA